MSPPSHPSSLSSVARVFSLLLLLAGNGVAQGPAAERSLVHQVAREGVLGTSSMLVVEAADQAAVDRVEAAVFGEVERLRLVLSSWDEASEWARLSRAGEGKASADLAEVLELAMTWRERSGGAFEPGVGGLIGLWQDAAKHGEEPLADALALEVAGCLRLPWQVENGRVVLRGACSLDAVAKGFVVDRAFAVGQAAAGKEARVLSFQIGGDLRVGSVEREVAVVDPRAPAANGNGLATVRLSDRAIASSGGYERGFQVGPERHSHILDPRTGRPCDAVLGASVVARDVATADVLATVLCVLGPKQGLELLAKVEGADGVVVGADGVVHESAGWRALLVPEVAEAAAGSGSWPRGFALQVEFEIKAPENNGRRRGGWKRPYVAVWIEDVTGAPARTLCLWLEKRRWLPDLRRWSQKYHDLPELVDARSQATRKAGSYTLTWDGTSDDGLRLAAGTYTVLIEVVREHGSYQLLKREVELGKDALHVDLPGNEEVARASLSFGPTAPAVVR